MYAQKYVYDCLVVLPQLYQKLYNQYRNENIEERIQQIYKTISEELTPFAEEHQMDTDLATRIGNYENYAFSEFFDFASTLYPEISSKHIILPEGLTRIPSRVFSCNEDIESIIIPSSMEIIESYSFDYCDNLQKVVLLNPDNISHIGENAFYSCESLSAISLGKNTQIDSLAFSYTKYLHQFLKGEVLCPENLFQSLSDSEQVKVSIQYIGQQCQKITDFLKENTDSILRYVIRNNNIEKCKEIFSFLANQDTIQDIMNDILIYTEEFQRYELRIAMFEHQKQIGIYPDYHSKFLL